MEIEEETLAFVSTIVLEQFPQLEKKAAREIAYKALRQDKVADSDWLKLAVKEFSYDKHFKKVRRFERKMIEAQYGKDAFKFLATVLDDPTRVAPRWACHFLEASEKLGRDEVKKAEDPYFFVRKSPKWSEAKKARKYLSATQRKVCEI